MNHPDGEGIPDAEIICAFMEPDAPANGGIPNVEVLKKYSPNGWWRYSLLSCNWKLPILFTCPEVEKLGRLHEVEARLTDGQWLHYGALCWIRYTKAKTANDWEISHLNKWRRCLIHLTAAQKIAALAEVIRLTGGQNG